MLDRHYRLEGKRIWVAGDTGMVGSAIVRRLAMSFCEILTVPRSALDLRRQAEVEDWVAEARPDVVILAAARVGGILANDRHPARFLHDNLAIQTNVLEVARQVGVEKLLFLGSSCIYPRLAEQPIREDSLLTGPLEPTNQWYAIAKIAGIKLCQAYRREHGSDFISAQPTNLYGPHDNFDLQSSHMVPALIAKAHQARRSGASHMTVWGTGRPRRELMFVDDCSDAMVHLLQHYSGEEPVNVGTGVDLPVAEIARTVADVVGFRGELRFDPSMPDGTPRKLLDVGRLEALGWRSGTGLAEGLERTYEWYLEHQAQSQPQPAFAVGA